MAEKWTELVIGIILIISPWVFGFSDISVAMWCNVLIGLFLAIVSAWAVFGEPVAAMPAQQEIKKERSHKKNSVEQK